MTLRLAQDRDRIAQSVNDVLIRRIFAAGLDLQAALELIGKHRAASKIWHAIGELDQAVSDIRATNTIATGPGGLGPVPAAHGVDLPICTAALIHPVRDLRPWLVTPSGMHLGGMILPGRRADGVGPAA